MLLSIGLVHPLLEFDISTMASQSMNSSFSYSEDESPFFADMTLDLAEAHDIAVTPEPTRQVLVDAGSAARNIPKMPPILDDPLSSPEDGAQEFAFDDTQGNNMKSITSEQTHGKFSRYNGKKTSSSRRWLRDTPWAVAFCLVVPLSLLVPIMFSSNENDLWLATASAPRLATMHTVLWGYVASLVLSRLLYRTMGGGDGDDARHIASQVLLISAPISVSVYIFLILTLYFMTPKAFHYAIIPAWFLARDIYLFRNWKMTATTPGGRQAFFQALTCMTLDILSRSLRRSSFYRMVNILLVVQLLMIMLWRVALLSALRSQNIIWIFMAGFGGKWATGTVARLLTLIASGGISSWFTEQNSLMEELKHEEDEETIEFTSLMTKMTTETSGAGSGDENDNIPEAYRTASASAYKSVLIPDEGIDDDFEDEVDGSLQPTTILPTAIAPRGSTVKQLLFSGLSISFGSVAKCGLLGGVAQFLWSQLRKIDTARATFGGLQGMSIGNSNENSLRDTYLSHTNLWAREFVRSHSDMAMSHVAAFQKSYQRASQDVAILIDESGEQAHQPYLLST